jgi:hypothetical protein
VENSGREKAEQKKTEPGRFAEGPRQPRLILPASAVSEQETRQKQTLQGPAKTLQKSFQNLAKSGGFFGRKI